MTKKYLMLVVIILTSFVLVACGNPDESTDKIVIWHDKEESIANIIESSLTEAFPDVVFELVRRESLTETLKLVGNNPSTAPDMYMFAHDKVGLFAEIGILAPITDFIEIDELNDYLPFTLEAATYDGTLYQLPLYFETLLFMYNRDRLSEDEVPTTTEELLTYMRENTDARRYAFVEQHSNAYYSAGWIHGFGGRLMDENGMPMLDDPKTIRALEYHLEFIEYMPIGQAEYATVNTLFYERQANSIIGGPWMVPTARDRGIDLGFAPMPVVDETGLPLSPYAGIQGIHVLDVAVNSEEKEVLISAILRHLLNPELSIELALESGSAPAQKSAYNDPAILENELVMAMRSAAENAIPMPNVPQMDILWVTANDLLVNVNLQGDDLTTAAEEAQSRTLELIETME